MRSSPGRIPGGAADLLGRRPVAELPQQHRDPFDRLLVTQAASSDARLLTADAALASYAPPVLMVT